MAPGIAEEKAGNFAEPLHVKMAVNVVAVGLVAVWWESLQMKPKVEGERRWNTCFDEIGQVELDSGSQI